jgi:hypothetical protein
MTVQPQAHPVAPAEIASALCHPVRNSALIRSIRRDGMRASDAADEVAAILALSATRPALRDRDATANLRVDDDGAVLLADDRDDDNREWVRLGRIDGRRDPLDRVPPWCPLGPEMLERELEELRLGFDPGDPRGRIEGEWAAGLYQDRREAGHGR